ncbi:hypothetical protein [Noviherbaspirillum massiliense]|uniref:hypothetical protein n=1 Tax=Noviherbaspirillum massiliense TaxID=1465823 RepID=UPI00030F627F|nr:hypothetical protein [Noviherbaspirillum massiliense]
MAANTKNKYPADKAGTRYAEFKNTKRVPPGKTRAERMGKQPSGSAAAQPPAKQS